MKRKLPNLRTDEAAEKFVAESDLTQYDLRGMRPVRFEFTAKDARVNMRMSEALLEAVKSAAEHKGIPYQRFIRETLEQAVAREKR